MSEKLQLILTQFLKNGNYICALGCSDEHSSEFPCTIKDSKALFKKNIVSGIIEVKDLNNADLLILREDI